MIEVGSFLVHTRAPRLLSLLCLGVAVLAGGIPGGASQGVRAQSLGASSVTHGQPAVIPGEFNGDLSMLPALPATVGEPPIYRPLLQGPPSTKLPIAAPSPAAPGVIGGPLLPMPSPLQNFAGMSRTDACTGGNCGTGWPPDTTGDVGPNHYIQAVNSSVAIYNKTGTLLASFTENQLWLGVGSTPCNGNSRGDPVVLYDWLSDRFVLSWFAFGSSGGAPVSPFYQCIAASKTSDPVAGGWWLYAVRMDPGGAGLPPVGSLNDYGKIGLWHDCLYFSANEFAYPGGSYNGVLFGSFSRADMYSGAALTYSLGWLPPATNAFTLIPSNNQGKGANAAQPGTPNYFVSESGTAFAFEVRRFTAGPNCGAGGTLSALTNVSQAPYGVSTYGSVVPQPNTTNRLDNIGDRLMQKVQYRKIGGVESLWVTHNVETPSTLTAIQWAQINVTGGTIVTTPVQQQIYQPDTTLWRWMGSLAVDGQGNMALGYSTSNGTSPNFPSIAYSGRLAGDPLNTLPQTEVQLIAGAGSQVNTCGGGPCHRWGDYSSMSVDPVDDCTFWYTTEYYSSQANGNSGNWQTRIGSFKFPSCTATADLAVTKTDGSATAFQGLPITYTIVVNNSGPSAVTGASIADTVPAAITGATWTCAASAGSSCPASGSGSINTSAVNLLAGGTATFTLTGTVSPSATGTLANTATVSVPIGVTDPNLANNSATDTDTIAAASNNANLANLVLSAGTLSPAFASGSFSYTANVVSNSNTLTVTPTVADSTASVMVNGVTVASGSPSGPITLNVGSNPITVFVTAQDGVTTTTYTVTVSYLPLSSCTYSLSPIDLSNTAAAGASPNITVTTPAGCPVSATSFQPWVIVSSITPSGGTTTVALQISPNAGAARSTAIVVANRLYLITQLNP